MSENKPLHTEAQVLLVQQHQLNATGSHLGAVSATLAQLRNVQATDDESLDALLAQANVLVARDESAPYGGEICIDDLLDAPESHRCQPISPLGLLDSARARKAEIGTPICARLTIMPFATRRSLLEIRLKN